MYYTDDLASVREDMLRADVVRFCDGLDGLAPAQRIGLAVALRASLAAVVDAAVVAAMRDAVAEGWGLGSSLSMRACLMNRFGFGSHSLRTLRVPGPSARCGSRSVWASGHAPAVTSARAKEYRPWKLMWAKSRGEIRAISSSRMWWPSARSSAMIF